MPFIRRGGLRPLTRVSLSFAFGFVMISAIGIAASIVGIEPMLAQASLTVGCIIACIYLCSSIPSSRLYGIRGSLEMDDVLVLSIGGAYILACLVFFNHIGMWMGGDALAHAEMIRMLLDGRMLPVGLPMIGSYSQYYPKGFHYYAYPWARMFPLLDVIQVLPVVVTAFTSLLLYSLVREMRRDVSSYSFLLAALIFPAHYSYLIWGGYPTASAETLLVAAVLSSIVMIWTLPVMLLGVLLAHPRVLAIALALLAGWFFSEKLGRFRRAYPWLFGVAATLIALPLLLHRPEYLSQVFSDKVQASDFVARWYPAFLSIFGAAIALLRMNRLDRLALTWSLIVIFIVVLSDVGVLSFIGTADRLLLPLYLPLSILGAYALTNMEHNDRMLRISFVAILAVVGFISLFVVLESYAESWGMMPEDYDAIMWIGEQGLSDVVCVNLDETGAWVYPITGIRVARSRFGGGFDYRLSISIAKNPNDSKVLERLRKLGHENVLVYVSSVSINRPGHEPPFAVHAGAYPIVNMSFSPEHYELLYDKGARIYRARG